MHYPQEHEMENGLCVDDQPVLVDDSESSASSVTPVRHAIRSFSCIWFTISLGTGVLSIILRLLPYRFHGIDVLATILFVLDITLFTTFMSVLITRFALDPRLTIRTIFHELDEIAFLTAPGIVFLTVAAQVAVTCSASWGYPFSMIAYVMWWIGVLWITLTCSTLYCTLSNTTLVKKPGDISTACFLPLVGVQTIGAVGGLIANYGVGLPPKLLLPLIMVSFLAVGYGTFLSLLVYAIYLHKLMVSGWPRADKIPGLILLVGPMGQPATALQLLGKAASAGGVFAKYDRGTFLQAGPAAAMDACCILLALLFLGFGVFWITIAVFGMINHAVKGQLVFNLRWWSTIFPLGTVTTAMINLSIALDSTAFKVLATGLFLILMTDYLILWCFMVRTVLRRESFTLRRFEHPEEYAAQKEIIQIRRVERVRPCTSAPEPIFRRRT